MLKFYVQYDNVLEKTYFEVHCKVASKSAYTRIHRIVHWLFSSSCGISYE